MTISRILFRTMIVPWKVYLKTSHKAESIALDSFTVIQNSRFTAYSFVDLYPSPFQGSNWSLCPLKKSGHFKVWTLSLSRSWESQGISKKRHFRNNLNCFESHGELLILSGVKTVSSVCDRNSLFLRGTCEVFKGEVLWCLQFASAQFRKKKYSKKQIRQDVTNYWS